MTLRTLIQRSLRFHWRAHLGVVLGAAVGSAALIGALVVGESVKRSLRETALLRLGEIFAAIVPGDRFFRDDLGLRLHTSLYHGWWKTNEIKFTSFGTAPATGLLLTGTASRADGRARANRISLVGFEHTAGLKTNAEWCPFFRLRHDGSPGGVAPGDVLVNERLASQLGVEVGDHLIFRVPRPSRMPLEAATARRADGTVALNLRVAGVLPPRRWGDFELRPGSSPPLNAFVNLDQLQRAVSLERRSNLLLFGSAIYAKPTLLGRMWDGWPTFVWLQFTSLLGTTGNLAGHELAQKLNRELTAVFHLDDAEVLFKDVPDSGQIAVVTQRVFIESPIENSALAADTNAQPLLTYLANQLRAGTNATPYSMVTAAGPPWTPADLRDDEIVVSQWLAEDLQVKPGEEIALVYFDPESGARLVERTNSFRVRSIVPMELPWADRTLMPDFPGIEKAESTRDWDAGFPLTYKIRQKDEDYWKQYRGTPKAFITLAAGQKMWANRFGNLTAIRFPIPTNEISLAPGFSPVPNAANGEKPFQTVSPAAHTDATGLKPGASRTGEELRAALEKKILAHLKPEELGLRFEPVREQALKAAEESQDFGGLFLGFSFFLIAAALVLMALLFSLGLEQRAPEIGTLLALGFAPRQVRRLLLVEGVALSLIGGILGAFGGPAYAKAMLHGLTTVWRDAVGASALSFHFTGQTLVVGLLASAAVSAVTVWLTLRKFVRKPAIRLLAGDWECDDLSSLSAGELSRSNAVGRTHCLARLVRAIRRAARRGAAWATSRPSGPSGDKSPHSTVGWLALVAALGLVGWAVANGDTGNAGIFFGAGALVLMAGLAAASAWLARRTGITPFPNFPASPSNGDRRDARPTLASLGLRGCARRRKRSLATMGMLACGSFLIVSIGVFRLDANRDAWKRTSGTGGFALIGETTMPVIHDLNTQAGRDFFALAERDLEGVRFVPFRVREGDEASCLNLNRAQRPRLLGVKPEMLEGRFAFAKGEGWESLISTRLQPGETASSESGNRLNGFPPPPDLNTGLKSGVNEIEIPAIGDANSIRWAMKKKVGDTLDYVDERGQPFRVRIVGAVANSILQGQLLIDEAEFVKRFPGESGYRMFLIDAPSNRVSQVSATLSRALQDAGLELTAAAARLAQFNAVQNTYLSTFQVLGGLGLLLGSVGLGVVVLRNVLERRGELAVLLAVGFRKRQLQRLLLIENGALLTAGLALGVAAAVVAVLPALLSPTTQLPWASLALTLTAVLVNGALWTWAATQLAVRGNLLEALRNE